MMSNDTRKVLSDAIARNSGLVVSLPSAGMLRHYKARFLAETAEACWIESVPAEGALIGELLKSGKPVGISFRNGTNKIVFVSPLLRREPCFRINADTTVEALLIAFPDQIKTLQRRSNYRVRVLPDSQLSGRVWRIATRANILDRPPAAAELQIELRDISAGGLGVTFKGVEGQPPKVTAEDRLRIQLLYKETPVLLEGRLRSVNPEPAGDSLRTGIHFKTLHGDLDGRQKLSQLTRIVGELQREEIRRCRLGLAS